MTIKEGENSKWSDRNNRKIRHHSSSVLRHAMQTREKHLVIR